MPPSDTQSTIATAPERGELELAREFERVLYENAEQTWRSLRWLGVPIRKLPFDLWMLQEIVLETRPALVIETGTDRGGSALFFATLFDLIGGGEVISVDVDHQKVEQTVREHPRVTLLDGSSTEPRIVEKLREAAAGKRTMVNLDSDHRAPHVAEELRLLAPLVTPGCYLVVEDTILDGGEIETDFGAGPGEALAEWLAAETDFETDPSRERLMLTLNPGGYLRRLGEAPAAPEAAKPASPAAVGEETGVESKLRGELLSQRRAIEASDFELRSLRHNVTVVTELAQLRGERIAELEQRLRSGGGDHVQIAHRDARIGALEAEIVELQVRLERIHSTLPVRIWMRLRHLPPLRWIARRRVRGFKRELDSRR